MTIEVETEDVFDFTNGEEKTWFESEKKPDQKIIQKFLELGCMRNLDIEISIIGM